MQHIGHADFMTPGEISGGKNKPNPHLMEIYQDLKIHPKGFQQIYQNMKNPKTAVMKFDRAEIAEDDLDSEAKHKADQAFFSYVTKRWGDKSRIYEWEECDYYPKTSGGPMNKYFGILTKGDYIYKCRPDLEDFWNNAHIYRYPVIWGTAIKQELVKDSKVEKDDPRLFNPCDAGLSFSMKRFYGHQNSLMKFDHNDPKEPFLCGFVKQRQGFQNIKRRFEKRKCTTIREGDCKKWDASMRKFLFQRIKRARWLMFHPILRTKNNYLRHNYYYDNVIESKMMMPHRQVIQKTSANPSGSENTTPDNCLGHLWINMYSFFRSCPTKTEEEYWNYVDPMLYGDDHLIGLIDNIEKEFTIDKMISAYAECGIEVSRDQSKDDPDLSNHTLLGSKFKKIRYQGIDYLVPEGDGEKALCSLYYQPKVQTLDQIYTQACSLEMEYAFSSQSHLLTAICDSLEKKGAVFLPDNNWLDVVIGFHLNKRFSRDEIIQLYLGLESGV